jgi:hypothetical protein
MRELTRLVAPVSRAGGTLRRPHGASPTSGADTGSCWPRYSRLTRTCEGLLYELPHAIEGAHARIASAGLESRCKLVAGSFFDAFPPNCDAYLMKSVLHNWDDERCAALLAHCRRDMPANARVLIVDRVMPDRITAKAAEQRVLRSDLNMLVGLGGRERTRAELELLLAGAGLGIERVVPVGFGYILIEAA